MRYRLLLVAAHLQPRGAVVRLRAVQIRLERPIPLRVAAVETHTAEPA